MGRLNIFLISADYSHNQFGETLRPKNRETQILGKACLNGRVLDIIAKEVDKKKEGGKILGIHSKT